MHSIRCFCVARLITGVPLEAEWCAPLGGMIRCQPASHHHQLAATLSPSVLIRHQTHEKVNAAFLIHRPCRLIATVGPTTDIAVKLCLLLVNCMPDVWIFLIFAIIPLITRISSKSLHRKLQTENPSFYLSSPWSSNWPSLTGRGDGGKLPIQLALYLHHKPIESKTACFPPINVGMSTRQIITGG